MTRHGALDFPVPLGVPRFPRGWSATSPIVDVYPVGFVHDVGLIFAIARVGLYLRRLPADCTKLGVNERATARSVLRARLRGFWSTLRRSWRRRSYWNGFLAEPVDLPDDAWTRCGHGWTRRRALRDLRRHVAQVSAKRFGEL